MRQTIERAPIENQIGHVTGVSHTAERRLRHVQTQLGPSLRRAQRRGDAGRRALRRSIASLSA
jgi:hypothetical protein